MYFNSFPQILIYFCLISNAVRYSNLIWKHSGKNVRNFGIETLIIDNMKDIFDATNNTYTQNCIRNFFNVSEYHLRLRVWCFEMYLNQWNNIEECLLQWLWGIHVTSDLITDSANNVDLSGIVEGDRSRDKRGQFT